MSITLTSEQQARYRPHILLPEIGTAGQEKLSHTRVLCVGAGGLGSPTLLYLAASGIGTLGIIDDDHVALSNLQRQILYDEQALQQPKTHAAQQRLSALNSTITVSTYPQRLNPENAEQYIANYDIIVDGSDNAATRYLLNDLCYTLQKPWIFASVHQFQGQCSLIVPGSACYRCLFPENINTLLPPNCTEQGVLGVLPGCMGLIQATEVIKWALDLGTSLAHTLLHVDLLHMQFHRYTLQSDPACITCGNKSNTPQPQCTDATPVTEINRAQLHHLMHTNPRNPLCLLDVRQAHERQTDPPLAGSVWIPGDELPQRVHELDPQCTTVVYCKAGIRSYQAAQWLQEQGFTDVMSFNPQQ